MPDISAAQYEALLNDDIPGLTASRLDWLCLRATSDAELRGWLNHGDESIDVALRHAYMAEGKRLHEADRVVTSLTVPNLSQRSNRTSSGALIRIGEVELYDSDSLPLLWLHQLEQRLGTVLRSEQQGWGLRVWGEVDPGPDGDEVLRSAGFQELGTSVGFSRDRIEVEGGGTTVLTLSGEVAEVSLVPLEQAALGPQTIVTRSPLPSRPKAQAIPATPPPAARTAAAPSQLQRRTWEGQRLTVQRR